MRKVFKCLAKSSAKAVVPWRRQWLSSAQRRVRRRQWSLGEGSDRSEKTVIVECLAKSSAEAVIAQRQWSLGGSGRTKAVITRRQWLHRGSDHSEAVVARRQWSLGGSDHSEAVITQRRQWGEGLVITRKAMLIKNIGVKLKGRGLT
jgi:hypothetical protein